jgi:plastocyanin
MAYMRSTALLTCAALAVALLGAASPSPVPTAAPSVVPSGAAIVVHIKNFSYVPQTLTIHPGQTVEWINDDAAPHSATADDAAFDSGDLDKGQSWSFTFVNAGKYTYYCDEHEFMKGAIVVK